MENRRSSAVEDTLINTQAGLDDLDISDRAESGLPVGWSEIEQENILLNPDAASMDDRG